jgi:hypothetical protein
MYDLVDVSGIEEKVIKHHKDLFPRLPGKKWYRTRGFKELAYVHGTPHQSYRKTSDWLNRVRHQPGATSARTLQDTTEAEGERLREHIYRKANVILQKQEFSSQGKLLYQENDQKLNQSLCLKPEEIESALNQLEVPREWQLAMKENPVAYENPAQSVNISLDDVGVKKQKEERQWLDKSERENQEKKRKSAYQTVVHVENQVGSYVFNALGVGIALQILLAFLLDNELLRGKLMVFLDGQRSLHSSVGQALNGWAPLQLILDGYHLEEKCKKQLSLALNNREKRNEVLEKLLNCLWHGLIEPATDYLKTIEDVYIKNRDALEKLRGYLERNRPFIPCYSVRKRLGLRNSSNVGEKSNDLLVSDRQKHNGMSWSQQGSVSLAAITALVRNREYYRWFTNEQINFKLVPYP